MELGHTCVPVSDAPDSVTSGDFATLQIKYIADFDTPDNQTFYACADIKFVEVEAFDIAVPCFNATESDDDDGAGPDWDYHDQDGDDNESDSSSTAAAPSSTSSANASEDESNEGATDGGKSSSGLSGGAIAGIVVGSVAGVGLIAAAALFLYRRKQQKQRLARQQASARGVEWGEQAGKGSVSTSSVRMQNLSPST